MDLRRSSRLAELTKARSEPLPAEIKLEILRYVLISPEKLAFCPLKMTDKECKIVSKTKEYKKYANSCYRVGMKIHSDILRLARWDYCRHDEPVAKGPTGNFSVLCLVSKATRQIARRTFFADIAWVLHVTPLFDAIDWVVKY